MDPETIEQLKSALLAEQARLERELSSFAGRDPRMAGDWDTHFPRGAPLPAASPVSLDEQADLREEYETEIAQEQSLESRLQSVERALARITDGSYGRCRTCGVLIPIERLRANPAAEYDMTHAPRGEF